MDEAGFWTLVESAHDQSGGDMDRKSKIMAALIGKLSKADATDFQKHFDRKLHEAYDYRLWGAAYVINGGCGDDAFYDFRVSLISRGKAAYEKALADPDSLAEDEPDEIAWFYEGYQYAVGDAVERVVGERVRGEPHPREPTGEHFDDETVFKRYPKLSTMMGYEDQL
jgi:hypothetical protein